MKALSFAALAAFFLAACGGGGQSAFVQPASLNALPLPSAAPAATSAPTTTPATTPAIAPTTAPTIAPTIAPSLKVIGGAPLTATAAQLSRVRTQSKTTAQGTTNGLPILVESSGMVATWAGDVAAWVTNAATSQDVPQTGLVVTPSNALPINNPAPSGLSCLGSVSGVCAVHPTAFQFGTSSANGKPIGKSTITLKFADGTSGTMFDYVYDGWYMPTCGTGWVYQGGVPVATATKNASDMYADCVSGNIVFPGGAILALTPSSDQYGNFATVLPNVTAAILMSSLIVNVPMAAIAPGQVFGINTKDGGVAKVYMVSSANPVGGIIVEGMSLHGNPDGSYAF